MKKTVLITGASSGIGASVAATLALANYNIIGIGRDFSKTYSSADYSEKELEAINSNTKQIVYDLTNTSELEVLLKEIKKDCQIDVLINCAGCAYYGTHETLTPEQIVEMTTVNLTVPMILSNLVLKDMKSNEAGMIINVSSVTARGINTHGCAYGATKAGLTSFGASLFEEARKRNIKVINIHPDITDTALYRNADFKAGDGVDEHLLAKDIAETILFAIKMPERMLLSDITIKPQKHRIMKK